LAIRKYIQTKEENRAVHVPNIIINNILWHIDLFLGKDLEIDDETTAVSLLRYRMPPFLLVYS
jgi:hypothetical protein